MLLHAPAKLNLCLYLGPRRDDGLHELCSLFEPLALADLIAVSPAERDEVLCPGVEGENLAARALAGLRSRGWGHPPLRIEIEKRVPVAAGLGGGSGDAAAILRLAVGEVGDLPGLAAELGADVPSQLQPALWPSSAAPESGSSRCPSRPRTRRSCCPTAAGSAPPPSSPRPTASASAASPEELDELATRLRAAAGAGASPLAYPGCSSTTSRRRRARCARRSATRSTSCAKPARRRPCSAAPARPRSALPEPCCRPDRGRDDRPR